MARRTVHRVRVRVKIAPEPEIPPAPPAAKTTTLISWRPILILIGAVMLILVILPSTVKFFESALAPPVARPAPLVSTVVPITNLRELVKVEEVSSISYDYESFPKKRSWNATIKNEHQEDHNILVQFDWQEDTDNKRRLKKEIKKDFYISGSSTQTFPVVLEFSESEIFKNGLFLTYEVLSIDGVSVITQEEVVASFRFEVSNPQLNESKDGNASFRCWLMVTNTDKHSHTLEPKSADVEYSYVIRGEEIRKAETRKLSYTSALYGKYRPKLEPGQSGRLDISGSGYDNDATYLEIEVPAPERAVNFIRVNQVVVLIDDEIKQIIPMHACNFSKDDEQSALATPMAIAKSNSNEPEELMSIRPTVTPWKKLDENNLPGTSYFGFNNQKPPFDNALVRRAFSCAIDRQTIVDEVFNGRWRPATTFVHPDTLGRDLYGEVGCSYNPKKARELLTQAGYPNGEGIPEILLMHTSATSNIKVVEMVQKMWNDILSVNVRAEAIETESFFEKLAVDAPQIHMNGWRADYNDPINFLKDVFHSESPYNYGLFSDPDYDAVVEAAAVETDRDKRLEMFINAERLLCETHAGIAPYLHFEMR